MIQLLIKINNVEKILTIVKIRLQILYEPKIEFYHMRIDGFKSLKNNTIYPVDGKR